MKLRYSDLILMLVCGFVLGGGFFYGMSEAHAAPVFEDTGLVCRPL
ncbi:hypothetical protein [Paraburkholderia youngii]|uniref:Uncharacterized protein n=1 Tax=Paraburkholderia youngii TaxID=2782701 RepID=A0A7Y6JVA7_9BURK|nr:hypothetical protein [Paraburkholderia youngii]NUX98760.1 hypothetical protein [Paraburkholderia youngii]